MPPVHLIRCNITKFTNPRADFKYKIKQINHLFRTFNNHDLFLSIKFVSYMKISINNDT